MVNNNDTSPPLASRRDLKPGSSTARRLARCTGLRKFAFEAEPRNHPRPARARKPHR
jgi:hypothetical protein